MLVRHETLGRLSSELIENIDTLAIDAGANALAHAKASEPIDP